MILAKMFVTGTLCFAFSLTNCVVPYKLFDQLVSHART